MNQVFLGSYGRPVILYIGEDGPWENQILMRKRILIQLQELLLLIMIHLVKCFEILHCCENLDESRSCWNDWLFPDRHHEKTEKTDLWQDGKSCLTCITIIHKYERGRSTIGHKCPDWVRTWCPGQDVLTQTSEMGRLSQDVLARTLRSVSDVLARTFMSNCTSAPLYTRKEFNNNKPQGKGILKVATNYGKDLSGNPRLFAHIHLGKIPFNGETDPCLVFWHV